MEMGTSTIAEMAPKRKEPEGTPFQIAVANNLRDRRLALGWSVPEAVEALRKAGYKKMSRSLLYQIERGVMFPAFLMLPNVAKAYQCTIHYLIPKR